MEEFFGGQDQEQQGGGNTIALFLGLYLLILAFFILLVSISTVEDVKSNAVMDSLSSTFTSLLEPSSDLTAFTSKDGTIIAGQEFQEQVTGIFAASLQVARIEVVQPGRQMRVSLPMERLFHVDEARIREGQYALLDRIVASVSSRPPGVRFVMEAEIGVKPIDGRDMPIGQTLEMRRAGAFARFMASRGIPPDALSIGLAPHESDDLVLWFYTWREEEVDLPFEEAEKAKAEAEAKRKAAKAEAAAKKAAPAPKSSPPTASAPTPSKTVPGAPSIALPPVTRPPAAGAPLPLTPQQEVTSDAPTQLVPPSESRKPSEPARGGE